MKTKEVIEMTQIIAAIVKNIGLLLTKISIKNEKVIKKIQN